jgi:hypothetical protein
MARDVEFCEARYAHASDGIIRVVGVNERKVIGIDENGEDLLHGAKLLKVVFRNAQIFSKMCNVAMAIPQELMPILIGSDNSRFRTFKHETTSCWRAGGSRRLTAALIAYSTNNAFIIAVFFMA